MRNLFISALVAVGLLVFGPSLFAAEQHETKSSTEIHQHSMESTQSTGTTVPNELTVEGQITSIQGDTLQVTDDAGYSHSFRVTDTNMLNNFKSGDRVEISIQSAEKGTTGTMKNSPAPTP